VKREGNSVRRHANSMRKNQIRRAVGSGVGALGAVALVPRPLVLLRWARQRSVHCDRSREHTETTLAEGRLRSSHSTPDSGELDSSRTQFGSFCNLGCGKAVISQQRVPIKIVLGHAWIVSLTVNWINARATAKPGVWKRLRPKERFAEDFCRLSCLHSGASLRGLDQYAGVGDDDELTVFGGGDDEAGEGGRRSGGGVSGSFST